MAPEHPDVERLAAGTEHESAVREYVNEAVRETAEQRGAEERQKTGVPLGRTITNPVNGEQIPMFVADYVLMEYGTGAIMAVPAHDGRDYDFAKTYDLPIRQVIRQSLPGSGEPQSISAGSHAEFITEHYWGYTCVRADCSEYRVEHPRWKVWKADTFELRADVTTLYGVQFTETLNQPPRSAVIAEGSPITIQRRSILL